MVDGASAAGGAAEDGATEGGAVGAGAAATGAGPASPELDVAAAAAPIDATSPNMVVTPRPALTMRDPCAA